MLSLGTISHGTMRTGDVFIALFHACTAAIHDLPTGSALCREATNACKDIIITLSDADVNAITDAEHALWVTEEGEALLHDLEEVAEMLAPPFTYYGAHEGDGADYGIWYDEDQLAEAVEEGRVLAVSDTSEVEERLKEMGPSDDGKPGWVKHVNDHGNVTLYRIEWEAKLVEEWAIV